MLQFFCRKRCRELFRYGTAERGRRSRFEQSIKIYHGQDSYFIRVFIQGATGVGAHSIEVHLLGQKTKKRFASAPPTCCRTPRLLASRAWGAWTRNVAWLGRGQWPFAEGRQTVDPWGMCTITMSNAVVKQRVDENRPDRFRTLQCGHMKASLRAASFCSFSL